MTSKAERREEVCGNVGCNVFGRLEVIARNAEQGDDVQVRRELLALLKFYPPRPKKRAPARRCPDCGERGEMKGHMTCQYPQDGP